MLIYKKIYGDEVNSYSMPNPIQFHVQRDGKHIP